jgi:hypothetical protein
VLTASLFGAPPQPAVVLELFTSQGCESCPPADVLLTQLPSDPRLKGRILPLSFHVDYWNDLGWRDPFSDARWTKRQKDYVSALASGTYTPQLVIGGIAHVIGSRESEVRQQIDLALWRPVPVELAIITKRDDKELRAHVTARWLDKGGMEPEIYVVVWESDVTANVTAGENAGKTLQHAFVVRELVKAMALPLDGKPHAADVIVQLGKDWKVGGAGVFAQDPSSRMIYGGAVAP